jgi:D-sedoheptulose 7-phosphate isomerase
VHQSDRLIRRVREHLEEHLAVAAALESIEHDILAVADLISETFGVGGKLLLCGNGGSAADAQHVAAEFVGRFESERAALPAIALTTDTSALTALSNDYTYDIVFSRQIEALANAHDCVIGSTTSGTSRNVLAAFDAARERGCRTVAFTGLGGAHLASRTDVCVVVPSTRTSRIQEAHILVWHIVAGLVEERQLEVISLTQDILAVS